MPVIREQRQFGVTPVRINRVDTGGQLIGEAVARAGQRLASDAFEQAAIVAEEKGQKAGLAATSADVARIDPNTGLPVAYSAPKGFGLIASRAYQNMIDRRFEESVLAEIKERGAEFASSSSSAAEYKERLTNYVTSMYEGATGDGGELNAYGRIVQDLGSEYVASTYEVLAKKEAEARRAALIRQQQMQAYAGQVEIGALISSGASPEQAALLLQREYQRNDELLNVQGISFSTWKATRERLDGLRSLGSANELASIYSALDERGRNQLKLAIQNPAYVDEAARTLNIDASALSSLIVDAKIGASVPSLLSGFDALGTSIDTEKELLAASVYSEQAAKMPPMLTARGLEIQMQSIPVDVRDLVVPELEALFVERQLDTKATDSETLDRLTNELLNSANFSLPAIREIAGNEVANLVRNMTPERRETLAKSISDRRSELARLESAGQNKIEESLRQEIRNVNSVEEYNALVTRIESAGLDPAKTDTLLGLNTQKLTNLAQDYIAFNKFENLQDLQNLENIVVAGVGGPDVTREFALLQEAYRIDPSKINSAFSRRVEAWNGVVNNALEAARINAIGSDLAAGRSVSPEDLRDWDASVTKNRQLNIGNWQEFPEIVAAANSGIIAPSLSKAISSAIYSNNEAQFAEASQLFEQYSNLSFVARDGSASTMDAMRASLDPKVYSLLSTTSYIARREGRDPISVLLELRNYEGDIDADIKTDLELPQNARIDRAFEDVPMSAIYRNEITSVLRILKARGITITKDIINAEIQQYTDSMAKDAQVIGPKIGDQTVYARSSYISGDAVAQNESALADALAATGMFNDLLDGGTVSETTIANLSRFLPIPSFSDMALNIAKVTEAFTGKSTATTEITRRDRIRSGLKALGVELYYDPVVSAFNAGVPTWNVGYMVDGRFEPIIVNDEIWTLQSIPKTESNAVRQYYEMFNNSLRENAPLHEQIKAELGWVVSMGQTDEQIANRSDFARYDQILRDETSVGVLAWSQVIRNKIIEQYGEIK
jgi:hypothetical protein